MSWSILVAKRQVSRVLQAQKRAYFVAQDAVRREDEMSKQRVSRINEEGEEEYWDQQADAVDNVSIISQDKSVP